MKQVDAMTGHITISIWLFVFLVAVVVWAILDRVLIPSTRWFLRRRINRVIDEIGALLDIEIKPFQITKRQVLIDRLVYDPEIVETIRREALQRNCPRDVVQAKIVSYAREIVPSFNAYLYFRLGYWLSKKSRGCYIGCAWVWSNNKNLRGSPLIPRWCS